MQLAEISSLICLFVAPKKANYKLLSDLFLINADLDELDGEYVRPMMKTTVPGPKSVVS